MTALIPFLLPSQQASGVASSPVIIILRSLKYQHGDVTFAHVCIEQTLEANILKTHYNAVLSQI